MEENKKNAGNKGKTFPLPPKKKKDTSWRKWVSFIWIGLIAVVLGISGLFFAVSQGFVGEMPDVKELENPDIFVASEIISSDGVTLGKFEKEKTAITFVTCACTVKLNKIVNNNIFFII